MTFAAPPDLRPVPRLPRRPARWRVRLYRALVSRAIDRTVSVLVVLNAVILALLCYNWESGEFVLALVAVDRMIAAMFVAEIGLKVVSGGRRFLRKPWNVFDTAIVAVGVFGGAYPLTVVRAFRVLRTLRLVRRVPSMRLVVESFVRALPGVGSVVSVMLLVLFIYAVVGTRLYGAVDPERFGTLHGAAFTLFGVLTLEGWDGIARGIMASRPGAWLFFVSFIAINSFVALNLIIAVMINAMHREYDEDADEERDAILMEVRAMRAELREVAGRLPPR